MSHHGPRRYILCYDIACPRRLGRVHRRVKRDGLALQYSLFDLTLTASQLHALVSDLKGIIHQDLDDVRIYGLHPHAQIATIGVGLMPQDIQFFNS
jgi:CRISPR-associated protein Cas2